MTSEEKIDIIEAYVEKITAIAKTSPYPIEFMKGFLESMLIKHATSDDDIKEIERLTK